MVVNSNPTPESKMAPNSTAGPPPGSSIADPRPAPAQGPSEPPAVDIDATTAGAAPADEQGRGRRSNMGKKEWNRSKKRGHNGNGPGPPSKKPKVENSDSRRDNRRKRENPFTAEEIASEERRPKRKVAALIGYSGTGYRGLQINNDEKTIEGDIMKAFIAAGAISKVNADDPKKVSLVRCARTDKGVHAAGNVLSLKLIIEDEDIVEKINENLPPQIRVWGIQRTNRMFNCYQACDSRWYEYLLPSYSLLPPHPDSFIGKKIVEFGKEKGLLEQVKEKYKDVEGFWEKVDEEKIKPILEGLDPETRAAVIERTRSSIEVATDTDGGSPSIPGARFGLSSSPELQPLKDPAGDKEVPAAPLGPEDQTPVTNEASTPNEKAGKAEVDDIPGEPSIDENATGPLTAVDLALRDIKRAYVAAKRSYRVSPERLARLQEALNQYLGTNNFHNYTVQKSFKDPSAKRLIKSFEVNPEPIIIGDTEWLSLKVHGQSFMMHQIRKMVGLATLVVRCGTDAALIKETYGPDRIAVPKAPALGLLLECPVFSSYNAKATNTLDKEPLDFKKYTEKIEPFKREYIYKRIFEDEEREHTFHSFYQQIDNFRTDYFLWITPGGIQAAKLREGVLEDQQAEKALDKQLGEEEDERKQEEEEG